MRREATQRERLSARTLLRIAWWVVFVLVLITVVGIRIRLLEIPLERDEGEYAYAGQLLLQGIPPYQLAYNMKFPGVYAAYALIMALFGQTPAGVHLGFLIVNLAAIALIFLIGQKLLSETAGLSAASAYAVLSISPSVLGLAAHATHFVMLPVLGAILILLSPPERRSLLALGVSGFLFGLGLLMKQPGVAFVTFRRRLSGLDRFPSAFGMENDCYPKRHICLRGGPADCRHIPSSLASRCLRQVLVLDDRLCAGLRERDFF